MNALDEFEVRVCELRAWANSRIAHCRKEELKFGRRIDGRGGNGATQVAIEAATERRALQAVLRILDGET